MSDSTSDARAALVELKEYAIDVRRASHQTVINAIQRYIARLDAEPLIFVAKTALPEVNFDEWYAAARATISSMVGSGELDWPTDTPARVALQAELFRRIAGGQIDLTEYTYNFHYVENRFNTNIQQLVTQDFDPFHRDFTRLATQTIELVEQSNETPVAISAEVGMAPPGSVLLEYISHARLTELQALRPAAFDLRKLIKLCEEIDFSFRNQCYLAVAALTRALLDHVPPIFGCESFAKVANNYKGGGRSFQGSMHHLQNSARQIGDTHLHVQIRSSESLPTSTQVNFANDLDVLLAEVIRVLR